MNILDSKTPELDINNITKELFSIYNEVLSLMIDLNYFDKAPKMFTKEMIGITRRIDDIANALYCLVNTFYAAGGRLTDDTDNDQ